MTPERFSDHAGGGGFLHVLPLPSARLNCRCTAVISIYRVCKISERKNTGFDGWRELSLPAVKNLWDSSFVEATTSGFVEDQNTTKRHQS